MKIVDHKLFRVLEKPAPGDKVLFLFAAMGTRIGLYHLFVKLMNRRGYSCIIYDYPLKVVHDANQDEWQQLFAGVINDAQEKMATWWRTTYGLFGA